MNHLHSFRFNAFSEQTYLLDHGNGEATVFDPGMSSLEERFHFEETCKKLGVVVTQCLLTHAHLDHVMGTAWVSDTFGCGPRLHPTDETTWTQAPISAKLYGIDMDELPTRGEDLGNQGAEISCGDMKLEIRLAPGHSKGHVVFVCHSQKFVIGGDVLFEGSIGRTDLPGGNPDVLAQSITEQLFSLEDDYIVYPGHGGPTSIGKERASNPFVNGAGTGMLQQ